MNEQELNAQVEGYRAGQAVRARRTQRRTGWFLVWTATVLMILAMVPGNDLAYGAAIASGLLGAAGWVHLRGARKR